FDLQDHKTYGGFVVGGVEVPWDVGETKETLSKHPHSATAVKVVDLAECPVGEQKGVIDIWLWGLQDWSDSSYTGIAQPPPPQDAEDGLPGANQGESGAADGVGSAAGDARRRPAPSEYNAAPSPLPESVQR
ncbi:MAG: hypothetical protein ABSH20_18850, partial [Tepidisphaeraceae bacterium]